jgi:DNA phosphorothioation-associated DGQHR protein 1
MNKFTAIRVLQPLGEFYLTAIPANYLLKVCFSDRYIRHGVESSGYVDDTGHQRNLDKARLKEISLYLQTQDAVFPGTIILAANCTPGGGIALPDGELSEKRWHIESCRDSSRNVVNIIVPTDDKIVAVVDGQHRLWGFENLSEELKNIPLPCAIFIDIPTPQQATIFATINFNQKPVNKSMTYELFGYNLDEGKEATWSPDKLAVFFARKLNVDVSSPFRNHIKVAAQEDVVLEEMSTARKEWVISTATIVEGILALISSNPKSDRALLYKSSNDVASRMKVLEAGKNPPPFREYYLAEDRDIVIYKTLLNYFNAVQSLFWQSLEPNSKSLIRKTAGIQALFQVLKELLPQQLTTNDFRQSTWENLLSKAKRLDFANVNFLESSGKGRARIRDAILIAIGRKIVTEIQDEQFCEYLHQCLREESC